MIKQQQEIVQQAQLEEQKQTIQQEPKRQRVNMFKKLNIEVIPKVTFKKVPLHFQLNDKPFFVLDHRSPKNKNNNNIQTATSFYHSKRPRSKQKIFQKRKCHSLRSGICSSVDPSNNRDTLNSEERIRRGKIFRNQNQVSIRDHKSLNVNDNMRQLISFNNTPKADRNVKLNKNITISYQSPAQNKHFVRSPEAPVSVRPVSLIQNWVGSSKPNPTISTPHQQFTFVKSPQVEIKTGHLSQTVVHERTPPKRKTFNQPMNPMELYSLISKISAHDGKKKKKKASYMSVQPRYTSQIPQPLYFKQNMEEEPHNPYHYRI